MSTFTALLADMHEAILTGSAAPAMADIKKNPRIAPDKQLAIYIDGYRIRLIQAIRADYPALLAYLGDEAFDALALQYAEKNPSLHVNLDRYPHGFAAFVHAHADDFAADLARLEGAIAEVFMLPESEPLDAVALVNLSPEAFGGITLKPRAASRLLQFKYPVNEWLETQRAGNAAQKPAAKNHYLYICRHHNNVQRVALEPAAYGLLTLLFRGFPVAEALDGAGGGIAAQLQPWFAQWLEKGVFAG